jgi:hypothetical protein
VVGADNIQVGGISTGVPVADTGNLSSSLAGVNVLPDATGDAGKSVAGAVRDDNEKQTEEARQVLAAFKPTFISVEVLSYGDGAGSAGDQIDEVEKKRREEEQRRKDGRQG